MLSIPVKQCTVTHPNEPKYYAEVGDTVSVHGPDAKNLIFATLESIEGERVTVKYFHDEESHDILVAEVVGVIRT